jgi:hypothetical protein
MDKKGDVEFQLEAPTSAELRNPSVQKIQVLKHMYGSFGEYLQQTTIQCDAAAGKKVAVNAQGLVLPCNFFNHNLYDARFHTPGALPGSSQHSYVDGKVQIQQFVQKYQTELDLNNCSLENIFKSKFWQELAAGWGTKDRIMECAMTCGEKFTKVWDQGGSIR